MCCVAKNKMQQSIGGCGLLPGKFGTAEYVGCRPGPSEMETVVELEVRVQVWPLLFGTCKYASLFCAALQKIKLQQSIGWCGPLPVNFGAGEYAIYGQGHQR